MEKRDTSLHPMIHKRKRRDFLIRSTSKPEGKVIVAQLNGFVDHIVMPVRVLSL